MSVEMGSIADLANVVLTGCITFFVYCYTKKQTDAQMEIAIREMISSARSNLRQIIMTDSSIKDALLDDVKEELLNAYDEACAKYIDKKIDQKTFRRMYENEIKNILKNDQFKTLINWPESKFPHIINVYQEWNQ